eukprot:SAG11_NODE_37232_length_258_cov_0.509434_2_plen_35_part_00
MSVGGVGMVVVWGVGQRGDVEWLGGGGGEDGGGG